eukprot:5851981-Amphidinium_carterae.1
MGLLKLTGVSRAPCSLRASSWQQCGRCSPCRAGAWAVAAALASAFNGDAQLIKHVGQSLRKGLVAFQKTTE